VNKSRSAQPWRRLCEIYAKLIGVVVQHWIFLVGCWQYANRSLTKAAQTVQKHAWHLASVFGQVSRLSEALAIVQRCLAAGCRINKSKKDLRTYQLLLALHDDSLA
jgi:TRAP-type C4-dicarboxylate transport system permease small subunit